MILTTQLLKISEKILKKVNLFWNRSFNNKQMFTI